jgi:hypothetical protein
MLNWFVAGKRAGIIRKPGEYGQGEEKSERPEALGHSEIPREPTGANRSVR